MELAEPILQTQGIHDNWCLSLSTGECGCSKVLKTLQKEGLQVCCGHKACALVLWQSSLYEWSLVLLHQRELCLVLRLSEFCLVALMESDYQER